QEQVRLVTAVDRQRIGTVVRGAAVQNVDDVVARRHTGAAGRVDEVGIGPALAVEVKRVAPGDRARGVGARPGRGHRRQLIDGERVLADAAKGKGLAAQECLVEGERVVVAVAEDRSAVGRSRAWGERAAQLDGRADTGVRVEVITNDVQGRAGGDDAPGRGIN